MLSLNEQEKEYLFILGFCYLQQHKYSRAETVFRALRLVFPEDLLATKCLAYVLFARRKTSQAEELFQQLATMLVTEQDKVWANFMRLMLQTQTKKKRTKP